MRPEINYYKATMLKRDGSKVTEIYAGADIDQAQMHRACQGMCTRAGRQLVSVEPTTAPHVDRSLEIIRPTLRDLRPDLRRQYPGVRFAFETDWLSSGACVVVSWSGRPTGKALSDYLISKQYSLLIPGRHSETVYFSNNNLS